MIICYLAYMNFNLHHIRYIQQFFSFFFFANVLCNLFSF